VQEQLRQDCQPDIIAIHRELLHRDYGLCLGISRVDCDGVARLIAS